MNKPKTQTVVVTHVLDRSRPSLLVSTLLMWPFLLLFRKVRFKGATVMTRMWPIMPTVLWQPSAVSSISPLGPVCRKYGSPVWADPSQDYIWLACAKAAAMHRGGWKVFDAPAEAV